MEITIDGNQYKKEDLLKLSDDEFICIKKKFYDNFDRKSINISINNINFSVPNHLYLNTPMTIALINFIDMLGLERRIIKLENK